MEAILAMSILSVVGMLMFKLSMNILVPRQWTLQQTLSDAYLTYEKSFAQRIPFETLTDGASPWPAQPQSASSQVVMGLLPGGQPLPATVYRTRIADVPTDNPASMKIWKVQSVLTYRIGDRRYVKSRTVVRAQ